MKNKIVSSSLRFQKIRKEKHKALRKKILNGLILVVVLAGALSILSSWQKINIDKVVISGNKVVETSEIEKTAKEELSGKYLFIIPKTNFLLYPKGAITETLSSKFRRLQDISMYVENFKTLHVNVAERVGLYTWCDNLVPDLENSSVGKCYFMDKDGYIFDEAPYFSGNIYLKFYGGIPEGSNPSGSYFLKDDFGKLISFKDMLQGIGLKPLSFYLDGDDIDVYLPPEGKSVMGPAIVFKANADYGKIIENLQSVLATEPLQSDFKNKYSSLEYIDLRFGNKVYYKFK